MATSIWFFVVPFVIAAAMPGPAQAALVGRVLATGPRTTIPFAAGMVAGTATWLCLAALGAAVVAVKYAYLFHLLKWLGIAYLLFLAWGLWRARSAPLDVSNRTRQSEGTPRAAVGGLLLTLGNPKAVLFFGAVLPTAFDLTNLTPVAFAGILALGVVIDGSVQACYVALAGQSRRWLQSPKRLQTANRGAAVLMAGAAAAIAARR